MGVRVAQVPLTQAALRGQDPLDQRGACSVQPHEEDRSDGIRSAGAVPLAERSRAGADLQSRATLDMLRTMAARGALEGVPVSVTGEGSLRVPAVLAGCRGGDRPGHHLLDFFDDEAVGLEIPQAPVDVCICRATCRYRATFS